MVEEQIRARGITEERILDALRRVPRELFVPPEAREEAYADRALPIGAGQTISQPYIVALMTSCLGLQGHERVLEVGAGSGYQTAILAELALEVFAVEVLEVLVEPLRQRLAALGYFNVHIRAGDGTLGWPEHAPYDGILVGAAAPKAPLPLIEQLADGGRLLLPIGSQQEQRLTVVHAQHGSLEYQEVASCVFVPLIGRHGWPG